MTAPFRELIPILICDDVPTSLAFYRDTLGFSIVNFDESVGKSGWASISCGPVSLMLASPRSHPESVKVDGTYPQLILYLYPEDLEAMRERVVAAGRQVSELRESFYGMREFDTTDPSGHVLWFGKSIEPDPSDAASAAATDA
ncbi:MAG: VOC family protein [Planctomycetota bacterium]